MVEGIKEPLLKDYVYQENSKPEQKADEQTEPKAKSCCPESLIIWIFLITTFKETAFGAVAPILSLQLTNENISEGYQSLIFSVYSLAIMIWSPLVGSVLLSRFNGKTVLMGGLFTYAAVFLGYSFIEKMSGNQTLIIAYAVILRLLQGIGSATIQTTQYAVGTSAFPEKKTLIVGGIECITSIGLALGP